MAREAKEDGFDEVESPTRRLGVVASADAREIEALLARGGEARDAQGFVEMISPRLPLSMSSTGVDPTARLDAIVHFLVSSDDLRWFPLGREGTALIAAADGSSTVSSVVARAGLSLADGILHLDMLVEMGLVALR